MRNRLAVAIVALLASASCSSAAPAGTAPVVVHAEGQGEGAWSLVGWRQGHSGDLCMELRGPTDRRIGAGCGFTLSPALHSYSAAGGGVVPGDARDEIVFGVLPSGGERRPGHLSYRCGRPRRGEKRPRISGEVLLPPVECRQSRRAALERSKRCCRKTDSILRSRLAVGPS